MTVSNQTLTRIQSLAWLYQAGYQSHTVDATIEKLIDIERTRLQRDAQKLEERLRAFEELYDLSSAEFDQRFHNGKMGDEADMFEWSAFYQMWSSVQEQLQTLNSES
jgi:hypothetical protein